MADTPLPAIHYAEIDEAQLRKLVLRGFRPEVRDHYAIEFITPVLGARKWLVKLTKTD